MNDLTLLEIQTGEFINGFCEFFTIKTPEEFIELLKSVDQSKYVLQYKYDGWFAVLCELGLFSKTGTCIRNDWRLPKDQLIVGEYLFGTEWAKDTAEYQKLIVYWNNQVIKKSIPTNWGRWIEHLDYNDVINCFWRALGRFEGYILKNVENNICYRWKRDYTGDYIITECIKSTAKTLKGWACSKVRISLYEEGQLVDKGTVSGMTNEIKKDLYDNPYNYIGQVLQVKGKGLFKSGKLRHPEWDRLRVDKKPEQCTTEQWK